MLDCVGIDELQKNSDADFEFKMKELEIRSSLDSFANDE